MPRLEFLQAEYDAHKIDPTGISDLWKTISDYWYLHKDKNTINTAWESAQRALGIVTEYSQSIDGIWGMDKYALTAQKAPVPPTQLFFGTEEYFTNEDGTSIRSEFYDAIPEGAILCIPTGVTDQYRIPNWIRYMPSLSDFTISPIMQLTSSDFDVDTSVLDNKTGTITFDPASDYKDVMWCSYFLQKSITDIIKPFGEQVGYTCRKEGRLETWAYRDVKALAYSLMNGPTAYNLELGISAFNLWPYTPFKCQVTAITGTTSIELKNIEDDSNETITIVNSTGLTFQQRTEDGWVAISVGDIVERYRVLTKACRVESWISDQALLISLGFSETSGRHKLVAAFDSDLPLVAAWDGWIEDISVASPSTPIPTLNGYAVDQARMLNHINRAKNTGTDFYFIAILDVTLDILDIATSYGITMLPPSCELQTSYGTIPSLPSDIVTTYAIVPNALDSSIETTYDGLTKPTSFDINTTYNMALSAPVASCSATSY